jgi:sulfite exporter TauE/SafE
MIGLMFGAALSGFVGSPHCAGMCGPFAAACGGSVRTFAAWHLGRLSMYGVLGAVAGGAGAVLPGPVWLGSAISALLVIGFSLVLAGLLPEPKIENRRLQRWAAGALQDTSVVGRFGLGLANGLLPCGLVYAALGLAVAAGSPLWGAAVMVAFGSGTTPALAAVAAGVKRGVGRSLGARRAIAGLVLVSGLFSVWMRTNPSAAHAGPAADVGATHEAAPLVGR